MKSIATAFAVVLFTVPFISAAADCTITNSCGGPNPENIASPWGTNSQVPHIKPGQYAADGKSLCPAWFFGYCVDISRTSYYLNR